MGEDKVLHYRDWTAKKYITATELEKFLYKIKLLFVFDNDYKLVIYAFVDYMHVREVKPEK